MAVWKSPYFREQKLLLQNVKVEEKGNVRNTNGLPPDHHLVQKAYRK
jgi:hypothetical protein